MTGQHRSSLRDDPWSLRVERSCHPSGATRDLADPELWARSISWAQQRRVSVPEQRTRDRRRKQMAVAMSVAMVGGTAAPVAATAATSGSPATTTGGGEGEPTGTM